MCPAHGRLGEAYNTVYLCMYKFVASYLGLIRRPQTQTFTLTFYSEGQDREIMVDLVVGRNAHDAYCTLVDTR